MLLGLCIFTLTIIFFILCFIQWIIEKISGSATKLVIKGAEKLQKDTERSKKRRLEHVQQN